MTDKEVTRYFMTVNEAAQLVIQAASLADDGNIFILDMGKPVRILDIAKRMANLHGRQTFLIGEELQKDTQLGIKITGLRPGEKLHEELAEGAKLTKTSHPRILRTKEKSMSMKRLSSELDKLLSACEKQRYSKC